MGDHYIPKYYLKGFTGEAGRLWAYDRVRACWFPSSPKSVANEREFYSRDVERLLADEVEDPGNEVLRVIRRRVRITQADKLALSRYMVCLLKRVPHIRAWVKDQTPGMIEDVIRRTSEQLDVLEQEQPERASHWQRRRSELDELPERFAEDFARTAWLAQVMPDSTPEVVATLSRMTWRFLTTDRDLAFLTSDNPVFYFASMGIGRPESEVSFPVSRRIILWATWRPDVEGGYANSKGVMGVGVQSAHGEQSHPLSLPLARGRLGPPPALQVQVAD